MYLSYRPLVIRKPEFTLTAANFPAQQVRFEVDKAWPISELYIWVHVTMAAAVTTQINYGLFNILKNVNVYISDGIKPRSVVNASGAGLLQFVVNEGFNLSPSTWAAIHAANANALVNGGIYRICYRVPFVHPAMTGLLRIKSMLPVHLHSEKPIVTLDFAQASEMCTGVANPFSSVQVDVLAQRVDMPRALADSIDKSTNGNPLNWFIHSDLFETQNSLGLGLINSEVTLKVATPGQYTGLLIHQLKGTAAGATIPADLSGDASYATATRWQLITAQSVIREWSFRHLADINGMSRAETRVTAPYPLGGALPVDPAAITGNTNGTAFVTAKPFIAPVGFGGPMSLGFAVQEPSSTFLDFLTDGITDANELGSLLDCNLPQRLGAEMNLIGKVTTPATYPSTINFVGRRLFEDLSAFQKFAA